MLCFVQARYIEVVVKHENSIAGCPYAMPNYVSVVQEHWCSISQPWHTSVSYISPKMKLISLCYTWESCYQELEMKE